MEFRSDEQIDSEPPRDDGGVCSTGCSNCPNCYHMMREIVELRTELGRLGETEKKKKKSFTIAPTMYTFYRNGLAKRHLARWVSVWLVMGRSASMTSSDILSSVDDNDTSYLENIIQQCSYPLPNPFFATSDFVNQYLFMCNEVCPCSYSTSSLGHILAAEPRLLRLKSPAYVFGDFHGNMPDLLAFARTMWPLGIHLTPGTFLFLGDYVDRGMFGIEVLCYLFAQKIMLPDKVFLLRGNHEVKVVNVPFPLSSHIQGCDHYYGNRCLLGQLKERFAENVAYMVMMLLLRDPQLWEETNRVFDYLPLAATIDDVIFCVHGGIPRPVDNSSSANIDIINQIPTPYELLPTQSPGENLLVKQLVTDLLWSDPARSQQEDHLDPNGFGQGERGTGAVCYGQKAIEEFVMNNELSHILRAHEPTASGVSVRKGAKVITIFSTSKEHNCQNAFCGCILVDGENIIAINHPDGTLNDGSSTVRG